MYVVDGSAALRTKPEALLGQYGFFYQTSVGEGEEGGPPNVTVSGLFGGRREAERVARRFQGRLLVPAGVELKVEEIASVEQAEKFTQPHFQEFRSSVTDRPDIDEISARIDSRVVGADQVLMGATVRLWDMLQERSGIGKTRSELDQLAQWSFDPGQGWLEAAPDFSYRTDETTRILGLTIGELSVTHGWDIAA